MFPARFEVLSLISLGACLTITVPYQLDLISTDLIIITSSSNNTN